MAQAQKREFIFPRNRIVHLNRWGPQFIRLLAVEECGSVVVMIVMLDRPRSEVKWNCTGYPLHSPVSPSLPLPCVTVCHQVPNELYQQSSATVPPSQSVSASLHRLCDILDRPKSTVILTNFGNCKPKSRNSTPLAMDTAHLRLKTKRT